MDVKKSNIQNIYPLSPMQEGLLFHSLTEPGSSAYFQQISYCIRGELNFKLFEQVWNQLLQRYDILRSVFSIVGSERPLQVVLKERQLVCAYKDLRGLSTSQQNDARQAFKQADRQQGYNLERDLLMRVSVLQLQDSLYEVVWSHHHILMDGWSLGLLQQEFAALYQAAIQGYADPLSKAIPFSRYIEWLEQQDRDEAIKVWQKYLNGYGEGRPCKTLTLPQKPHVESSKKNVGTRRQHRYLIGGEQLAALNNQAAHQQITLSTLLNGCWGLLLGFYNQCEDIVFGMAVSGRPPEVPGVETIVGLFINTLPVRVQFSLKENLCEFLRRLQREIMTTQSYQYLSLAEIQKLTPYGNQLLATHFTYENYPIDLSSQSEGTENGLSIESSTVFEQTHYHLDIQVVPELNGVRVQMNYNSEYFNDVTIQLCEQHFKALLTAFVDQPDCPIGKLDWLSDYEKRTLLALPEGRQSRAIESDNMIQRFEALVDQQPDHIALTCPQWQGRESSYLSHKRSHSTDSVSLTYQQLNEQANRLAHFLASKGINAGDRVGILMERSIDTVVGILAILKTGAAYLPMEQFYPIERVNSMAQQGGIRYLITSSSLSEYWPEGVEPLCLDALSDALGEMPTHNLLRSIASTDLAYIIFTSGSTGQPKGVKVSHGNVARLMDQGQQLFQFDRHDVWTLFHSVAFDFSVWELWGALGVGAKLVIVPYWLARDTEGFYQLLIDEKVTVLNQTPSAFRQLSWVDARFSSADDSNIANHLALRYVIFGGEKLEFSSLSSWFKRHGDQPKLVNMYGITETTVHTTFRLIQEQDCDGTSSLIGQPLADLKIYLLDEQQRPVALGVPGEMYIAGPGVSLGYWGRDDLAQERFIENPFLKLEGCEQSENQLPYQTLYRTGDLARWLVSDAKGEITGSNVLNGDQIPFELEYLGRIDSQVQLHGYRIELSEIQQALVRQDGLQDALVVLVDDENGDAFICAYLIPSQSVPSEKASTLIHALQETLKKHLPDYMIPTAWELMEGFPLTSNGKLDQAALPIPKRGRYAIGVDESQDEMKNVREAALANVWCKLLGLEKIDRHDNYFALGGDSIKAMQMVSRLRSQGYRLNVQAVFQNPTISSLATHLSSIERVSEKWKHQQHLQQNSRIPLLPIQQRFMAQDKAHLDWFNHAVLLQSQKGFDVEALQQALNCLVQTHEALRLSFHFDSQQEQWYQCVSDSVSWPITRVDLPIARDQAQWEQQLQTLATEQQRQLSIQQGPLIKAVLFITHPDQLNAEEYARESLLLIIHHLLVDGVSWRILLEDLKQTYDQACLGQKPTLPVIVDSLGRWSQQLMSYRQRPALLSELPYWQSLDMSCKPIIPATQTSKQECPNSYANTRVLHVCLDETTTHQLLTLANRPFNTTAEDLLLVALAHTFFRLYGVKQSCLLMEGHGRETQLDGLYQEHGTMTEQLDLSQTVGWFTALYPFRLALPDNTTVSDTSDWAYQIKTIKESLRQVPNRGLGYGVLKYLRDHQGSTCKDLSADPQISFNYLGQFAETTENSLFKVRPDLVGQLVNPDLIRTTELDVGVVILQQHAEISIQYSPHLFSDRDAQRFLQDYQHNIESVVHFCVDYHQQEVTPSDLSYSNISMEELEGLFE